MMVKNWIVQHCNQIVIALIAVLSPVQTVMVAIMFLIGFDFITGIVKAYKAGEKITSKKMANTIGKVIFYNIAIFTGIAINAVLATTLINAISIIASAIASIEAYSILENISAITNTDLKNAVGNLFTRIKEIPQKKD